MIGADQHVEAAAVARIGVEDFAVVVPVEYAGAGALFAGKRRHFVIVHRLAAGLFLRRRRDVIVEVEVAAARRHPFEVPAHARFEFIDLRQRGARHDDERHVALREVDDGTVKMIGQERAARAAGFPVGAEHEVIDDQLALAAEQVGQGFLAARPVEHVSLVDFHPGQLAPLFAQRIARAAKSFFLGEVRLAGGEPFVLGDDAMRFHGSLLDATAEPASSSRRRRHRAASEWRCGRRRARRTPVSSAWRRP